VAQVACARSVSAVKSSGVDAVMVASSFSPESHL
jgi:hypothetical protein